MDQSEQAARRYMLIDITEAIRRVFPSAQVRPFGSYPVSLSTFLSDVDVTVEQFEQPTQTTEPFRSGKTANTAVEAGRPVGRARKRRRSTEAPVESAAYIEDHDPLLIHSVTDATKEVENTQRTRGNRIMLPTSAAPNSCSRSSSSRGPSPEQQIIDLTGDTSSSNSEVFMSNSNKRHHSQLQESYDDSSGVECVCDERSGIPTCDLTAAYALADAYDSANNHPNSSGIRQDYQEDVDAVLMGSGDDYWRDSNCESATSSSSSSSHYYTADGGNPVKAAACTATAHAAAAKGSSSSSAVDSLQRLADLGEDSGPIFAYVKDEPRLVKIMRLQKIFDGLKVYF